MAQTRTDLDLTRKHLKNLTQYVISHLEALLEKYGPQYPRLTTKSARHEELDAKAVAFKSFKVAYDRESGYVGYKVSGEEFRLECTKFDKLLLVFRDGTYKIAELPEKLFVGQDLFYCALPERDRVFTCAYTDRDASYLKRFTFGGMILNKVYSCIPEKSRILYFGPDTPKLLYVRYKPAPHQKVSQQTCDPSQVEVKNPRTLGRQISIKDISSVTPEPTRGWDDDAATTKIVFA
jgi:topoisomerase-4 subunit A